MKAIFITGTDTEVGKTFITAGLGSIFMKTGLKVGIMKPIESGAPESNGKLVPGDVAFFKRVFNIGEDDNLINQYCFKAPISPGVAARQENVVIDIDIIKENFKKLSNLNDITLVEGAGGLMAPLTEKYLTNADLAKELDIPVLIVARLKLGTINHTMLTIEHARHTKGLNVIGVIFNTNNKSSNDVSTNSNPDVIKEMSNIKTIGIIPYYDLPDTINLKKLQNFFENRLDIMIN